MRKRMFALISLLALLSTSLAGCISLPCEWTDSCGTCGTLTVSDQEMMLGSVIPDFEGVDQSNQSWNASSLAGEVWIAYFSAPWCAHCETTLDAYDNAIPEDRLLVFNKDFDERYANMTEWQETASERIGRQIDRPFINAPLLADDLLVYGIPTAYVVDGDGYIVDFTLGAIEDPEVLSEMYEKYANPTGPE